MHVRSPCSEGGRQGKGVSAFRRKAANLLAYAGAGCCRLAISNAGNLNESAIELTIEVTALLQLQCIHNFDTTPQESGIKPGCLLVALFKLSCWPALPCIHQSFESNKKGVVHVRSPCCEGGRQGKGVFTSRRKAANSLAYAGAGCCRLDISNAGNLNESAIELTIEVTALLQLQCIHNFDTTPQESGIKAGCLLVALFKLSCWPALPCIHQSSESNKKGVVHVRSPCCEGGRQGKGVFTSRRKAANSLAYAGAGCCRLDISNAGNLNESAIELTIEVTALLQLQCIHNFDTTPQESGIKAGCLLAALFIFCFYAGPPSHAFIKVLSRTRRGCMYGVLVVNGAGKEKVSLHSGGKLPICWCTRELAAADLPFLSPAT